MTTGADTLTVLAVMALAAAICRGGGFWLMRFVRITPRVHAALNAIPIAVLMGIMAPALLRGGIPESAAVVARRFRWTVSTCFRLNATSTFWRSTKP